MVLRIGQKTREVIDEPINKSTKKNALFIDSKQHQVQESKSEKLRCVFKNLNSELHQVAYETSKPLVRRAYLKVAEGVFISLNSLEKRLKLTPQQMNKLKTAKADDEKGLSVEQVRTSLIEKFIEDNGLQKRDEAYLALETFLKPKLKDQQIHQICLKTLSSPEKTKETLKSILEDKSVKNRHLTPLFNEMGAEVDSDILWTAAQKALRISQAL